MSLLASATQSPHVDGYLRCPDRGSYNKHNMSKQTKETSLEKPCVFCKIINDSAENDDDNLVVKRFDTCTVMMNLYPYATGHILIMPNRHCATVQELTDGEKLDFMNAASTVADVLQAELNPEAFNFGINQGLAAGASKPGHIHMHVVPRNTGDASSLLVIHRTIAVQRDPKEFGRYLRECFKDIVI